MTLFMSMSLLLSACQTGDEAYRFIPSGFDGAGGQMVVAADPLQPSVLLAGSDVGGFNRSTDGGETWTLSNSGITKKDSLNVAAILYSRNSSTPNRVYAGVGRQGTGGGFLVSDDGGQSWRTASEVPQFAGGNTGHGLPNPYPRSTGYLIEEDIANGILYAGTFKDGLMRSSDEGETWTVIGLASSYIRSIALHPDHPDELFVAVHGAGVYRTTDARSVSPGWVLVPGASDQVEELRFVDGQLYAAGTEAAGSGFQGVVYTYTAGAFDTLFTSLNQNNRHTVFHSIDGAGDTLYVGAWQSVDHGNGYGENVYRSLDRGLSFEPITVDPDLMFYTMGSSNEVWWLSEVEPQTMIGGRRFSSNHITVDPHDPHRVYVAGRTSIWQGVADPVTLEVEWHPLVRNLNTTFNNALVVDPQDPAVVYIGSTDWNFLYSTDGLTHVRQNGQGTDANGLAVAIDAGTAPTTVYAGFGGKDNDRGEVYVHADPTAGGPWTSTGLGAATGGQQVVGLIAQRVNGEVLLLAALDNGGVYKRDGQGAWSTAPVLHPSLAMGPQSTRSAFFAGNHESALVYLYDRESGLWRSDQNGDAGSWERIWHKPLLVGGVDKRFTGYIALDPNDDGLLYLSTDTGLYRLDGADTGTVEGGTISYTSIAVPNPGPLAWDHEGTLLVASSYTNGEAGLYGYDGSQIVNIADNFYKANAGNPIAIAAGSDGRIYVSLFGSGIVIGEPPAAAHAQERPAAD